MEPSNFSIHNWVSFDSYQNPQSESQNHDDDDGEEEEEEEALSLCNMAAGKPATNLPGKQFSDQHQEKDFDFNLSEKQMCSADEVFFRGQILPFRHSVSLPSGFMTRTARTSISFSRSEPVSRSGSTGSHNSGTSGSNSPSGSEFTGHKPMTRSLNQFHSYPSPTPQIRTRRYGQPDQKPSPKWSFLQLGLLKPQEIGLADLKKRSQRSKMMKDGNQKKTSNHLLLFGGCKCSAIEVESGVSWRIPMVKPTALKQESNVGTRKHAVASHRTSEWLKQL